MNLFRKGAVRAERFVVRLQLRLTDFLAAHAQVGLNVVVPLGVDVLLAHDEGQHGRALVIESKDK